MNKQMQIVDARKSTARGNIPEYNQTDIDLVVKMVNRAYRTHERERKAQAERTRLRVIKQREESVTRRENEIRRREEEYVMLNRMVNAVINAVLIGFSILGMMTAFWFFLTI